MALELIESDAAIGFSVFIIFFFLGFIGLAELMAMWSELMALEDMALDELLLMVSCAAAMSATARAARPRVTAAQARRIEFFIDISWRANYPPGYSQGGLERRLRS